LNGAHRAAFRAAAKAMRAGLGHEFKDSLIFLVMGWHRGADERVGRSSPAGMTEVSILAYSRWHVSGGRFCAIASQGA
jgi:hypothetical protein